MEKNNRIAFGELVSEAFYVNKESMQVHFHKLDYDKIFDINPLLFQGGVIILGSDFYIDCMCLTFMWNEHLDLVLASIDDIVIKDITDIQDIAIGSETTLH